MKAVLEIKDNKVAFIMELLNNFSFVKVEPIIHRKEQFLSELKDTVGEVKLIKQGKAQGRPARELLDEL
jgi:hypothetical protein